MAGRVSLVVGFLRALRVLLEKLAEIRRGRLRDRASSDGSGLLLDKLNPGHTDASGTAESAKGDAERGAGRVDE